MANKQHIAIATLLTKLKAILHSYALTQLIAKGYFNYNNVQLVIHCGQESFTITNSDSYSGKSINHKRNKITYVNKFYVK